MGRAVGRRAVAARRGGRAPCRSRTRRPRRRGPRPRRGRRCAGGRKVASFMGRSNLDGLPISGGPVTATIVIMDTSAIKAAAAASSATYRSFADATRAVLDLLERQMPDGDAVSSRISTAASSSIASSTRARRRVGLRSNLATPLGESSDLAMAEDRGPRLCNDLAAHPVYGAPRCSSRLGAGAYLGVPLELSDGTRVGSLAALSPRGRAASAATTSSSSGCSPACSPPSSSARATSATSGASTTRCATRRADGRARPRRPRARRRRGRAPRRLRAACEIAGAPVAFLLEPSGREFVSTAMRGVDMAPVTIQPRARVDAAAAFTARRPTSSPTPARTRRSPRRSWRRPARARRCSSRCCATARSAGVLIVIWQRPARGAARRAGRRAAAAGRAGRGGDRARRRCASAWPALAFTDSAHRPRHAPRVGGGAAARARPRAPRRPSR